MVCICAWCVVVRWCVVSGGVWWCVVGVGGVVVRCGGCAGEWNRRRVATSAAAARATLRTCYWRGPHLRHLAVSGLVSH